MSTFKNAKAMALIDLSNYGGTIASDVSDADYWVGRANELSLSLAKEAALIAIGTKSPNNTYVQYLRERIAAHVLIVKHLRGELCLVGKFTFA